MSDRLLSPPIATATIAGLYLRQGLLDQAEALYLRLLEQRPGDAALEAGLAEARRRKLAKRPLTNDSKVSLEAAGEGLTCRWSISERGIAQANALLQGVGKITVRLVSFPLEEGRAGQEIILERAKGEITLKPPRGALTVSAAVGLLDLEQDDRFVAIAHCDPLQLGAEPRTDRQLTADSFLAGSAPEST